MMSVKHVHCLAVAAVIGVAAVSFSAPSSAGGLDLGGVVGGTIGGALGASGGASAGQPGVDAGAKASIGGIQAKAGLALYKKKLHANAKLFAGRYSHRNHGKLVKVTAVAGSKPLNAKAKILIGNVDQGRRFHRPQDKCRDEGSCGRSRQSENRLGHWRQATERK
jgi:hypothetical protein